MAVNPSFSPASDPAGIDQRVFLHGVSWQGYEAFLTLRGESSATRATYLRGTLEIISPSTFHEDLKKKLARLVETWCYERGVLIEGFGSFTVKSEPDQRGFEPDECYVLGPIDTHPEVPSLAIEVVWTSGGIDKLEVYRGLRVPEAWIYEKGELRIYQLDGDAYRLAERSRLLPELDPALLTQCMATPSQSEAVMRMRDALRGELPASG